MSSKLEVSTKEVINNTRGGIEGKTEEHIFLGGEFKSWMFAH